jgi:hypothetical protein
MPPANWPSNIVFIKENIYSNQLTPEELANIGLTPVKAKTRPTPNGSPTNKLIKIKKISDPKHPANGQFGLFANQKLPAKSHVIDYVGYVHPNRESDPSSDYDISLDSALGIGIDAQRWGCEARMINDYRGINATNNVIFDNRMVGKELRIAVFVGPKDVNKGEELCINYGKGFWKGRAG